MVNGKVMLHHNYIHNQQLAVIAAAQAIKISAVRDVGKGMFPCGELQTIGFHRVDVSDRGGEGDVPNGIGHAFPQDLYALKMVSEIGKDDRLNPQGISRSEQPPMMPEPTVSHCLNHDINISGVVQVAMSDNDGTDGISVEIVFVELDNAAGTGVNKYFITT